jgi:Ninjurin
MEDIEQGERALSRGEQQLLLEKKENDFNAYATSKSVSQTFLDSSNIQAQIALLVALFATRDNAIPLRGFEITLVTLIAASLVIQFLMFIMLFLLAASKDERMKGGCTATALNSLVTALSGLALILNIVVSVVSVETMKLNIQPVARRALADNGWVSSPMVVHNIVKISGIVLTAMNLVMVGILIKTVYDRNRNRGSPNGGYA